MINKNALTGIFIFIFVNHIYLFFNCIDLVFILIQFNQKLLI